MQIRATIPNYAVQDMHNILIANGHLKTIKTPDSILEYSKMMTIWGASLQSAMDNSENWNIEVYDEVVAAFKKYWSLK